MNKVKTALYIFLPLLIILLATKWILFDYVTSNGKRVGNLTKFSKKGRIFKTWEGTIDEGSGDKLTSYFSVKSDKLAQELFKYEGRKVVIYYNQHLLGFPRDTNYVLTDWKPFEEDIQIRGSSTEVGVNQKLLEELQKGYFCSLLGTLYANPELYQQVKEFTKERNLFLYKKIANCN
jgi:hypothetical protein